MVLRKASNVSSRAYFFFHLRRFNLRFEHFVFIDESHIDDRKIQIIINILGMHYMVIERYFDMYFQVPNDAM